MTGYKWKAIIEGTIKIGDTPMRESPSLNSNLCVIKYKISADETEMELHRCAVYHGDNPDFWPGSLFGRYSRKGAYTLRGYNQDT